jgi:alpha-tubulin suppressor-like RCC1 family protein
MKGRAAHASLLMLFCSFAVSVQAQYRSLQATEHWLLWLDKDGRPHGMEYGAKEGDEPKVSLASFMRSNEKKRFKGLWANHDRELALGTDGSIIGFGENQLWALGQSVAEHRLRPVAPWERFSSNMVNKPRLVFGVLGATQVAVGGGHTLAVLEDGALCAWGFDDVGQTGMLLDEKKQLVPWKVAGLPPIRMAAAGDGHSMALDTQGHVWAWGLDNAGQLGDALLDDRYQPWMINELSSVVEIAAGAGHSLALDEQGRVWSWGSNDMGELMRKTRDPALSRMPMRIKGLPPIVHIVAGDHFSAALDKKGWVWWWGAERALSMGELGRLHRLEGVGQIKGLAAFSGGLILSKEKPQKIWLFLKPFDKAPLLLMDGKATAH